MRREGEWRSLLGRLVGLARKYALRVNADESAVVATEREADDASRLACIRDGDDVALRRHSLYEDEQVSELAEVSPVVDAADGAGRLRVPLAEDPLGVFVINPASPLLLHYVKEPKRRSQRLRWPRRRGVGG